MDRLQALEGSLRAAAVAGLFADVQRLLTRYVAEVERTLREDSLSTQQVRAVTICAHRLFDWTATVLANLREADAAEATRLSFVHSYDTSEGPPPQIRTQG